MPQHTPRQNPAAKNNAQDLNEKTLLELLIALREEREHGES
jgi:hypothetical protein